MYKTKATTESNSTADRIRKNTAYFVKSSLSFGFILQPEELYPYTHLATFCFQLLIQQCNFQAL